MTSETAAPPLPETSRAGDPTARPDRLDAQLIRYGGAFAQFVIDSAEGSWLQTEDGRRILDFTSGQMCW